MSFSGMTSFWSRSFEEYRLIFGLTETDLAGLILGCADGPASFNAEATASGHRVISCDPTYAYSATEIERRVEACYDVVMSQVSRVRCSSWMARPTSAALVRVWLTAWRFSSH